MVAFRLGGALLPKVSFSRSKCSFGPRSADSGSLYRKEASWETSYPLPSPFWDGDGGQARSHPRTRRPVTEAAEMRTKWGFSLGDHGNNANLPARSRAAGLSNVVIS
jgi:hypothetical protein